MSYCPALPVPPGLPDAPCVVMGAAVVAFSTGPVALPSAVITAWKARVSNATTGLPNGVGDIQLSGNQATITVTWQATSATTGAANAENKYVTEFII